MNQILCEILLLWKTSVITRPYWKREIFPIFGIYFAWLQNATFILWTPFAFSKKNESSPNVNVIPNVTFNVPTMNYGPKISYRKVTNTVMNLFFYLFEFSTRFHIFHDMYAYTFLHFCCIQWIFLYIIILIESIFMLNREPVTFF